MEELNMNNYAEEIKEIVLAKLGEGFEVEIREVLKNNGVVLPGLAIRSQESPIAAIIYVNDMYNDGICASEAADKVINAYRNSEKPDINVAQIKDWESVKNQVTYKLVNAAANEELLHKAPYVSLCGDLALIFTVPVMNTSDSIGSFTVLNIHMKMWGINTEELYDAAGANTPRIFPVEHMDFAGMDILTNSMKINGATVIFYENVLKDFANEQGGFDLYLLPSSVHEFIVLPVTGDAAPGELAAMVTEINSEQVEPEEKLSDHVYMYKLETDEIICVA